MRRLLSRVAFTAVLLAISQQSMAQDWPQARGRALITVKGSRFSLPTDETSLRAFTFAPLPDDADRAIILEDVLGEPDNARQKFGEWDKVVIRHATADDDRHRVPVAARATREWVATGSYQFEVTGVPNSQCQHYLRDVDFLFGSIVRPPEGSSPQKTEYLACAGFNIVARYTSLTTDDWSEETLPALHDSITRLFDRMLVNLRVMARYRTPPVQAGPRESYKLVLPEERPAEKVPCDMALETQPLPLGKRAVAGTPGFGEVFGKIIEASDCKREQILDYVKRIGA